jgi:hypothetical protein
VHTFLCSVRITIRTDGARAADCNPPRAKKSAATRLGTMRPVLEATSMLEATPMLGADHNPHRWHKSGGL